MTDPQDTPPKNRRTLGAVLAALFAFALIMGPGPGVMLVNTPKPILGLPAIYLWGLLWYVVEVVIVVLAYKLVWTDGDESDA
jgi:hypothetical protein